MPINGITQIVSKTYHTQFK